MQENCSRAYASIDLAVVKWNLDMLYSKVSPNAKVMAVIKTDGYGHGAVPIAQMLEGVSYIWGYAVATLEEAVSLRKEKIEKPILVLGCIFPEQYQMALKYHIRMTVYTDEFLEQLSKTAEEIGEKAYVHVKIDTGMGRLGFACTEEDVLKILKIKKYKNIIPEGIFTHHAKADEIDKTFANLQAERFTMMKGRLKQAGMEMPYSHTANSAAIMELPDMAQKETLVRAGIALYGIVPSDEVEEGTLKLKPALSLKSRIVFIKRVPPNTPIGYGGTYITTKECVIATIPIGYGDGYPRELSGKGYVLIQGERAPIIGRICMDQMMVDVSNIKALKIGEVVTLIGKDKEQCISVEELSKLSGRFHYEIVCGINKRITRVYVNDKRSRV